MIAYRNTIVNSITVLRIQCYKTSFMTAIDMRTNPLSHPRLSVMFFEIRCPIAEPKKTHSRQIIKHMIIVSNLFSSESPAENPEATESTDSANASMTASLGERLLELSASAHFSSIKILTAKDMLKSEKDTFAAPQCFFRYAFIEF